MQLLKLHIASYLFVSPHVCADAIGTAVVTPVHLIKKVTDQWLVPMTCIHEGTYLWPNSWEGGIKSAHWLLCIPSRVIQGDDSIHVTGFFFTILMVVLLVTFVFVCLVRRCSKDFTWGALYCRQWSGSYQHLPRNLLKVPLSKGVTRISTPRVAWVWAV